MLRTFLKTKFKEALPFLLFAMAPVILRKTRLTTGGTLGLAGLSFPVPPEPPVLTFLLAAFSVAPVFAVLLVVAFWLFAVLLLGTFRRTILTVWTRPSC